MYSRINRIVNNYNYLMQLDDPRVSHWPLLAHPWYIILIIMAYLYTVYVVLPRYMINRKPFELKYVIMAYNLYQLCACTIVVYFVATSGWTTEYHWKCQPVDYSNNRLAIRMAKMVWWHMMLRMSEFVETVFFVLRKKSNQVSPLHVFHHVSTLVLAWITAKYCPGGYPSFTILLNLSVHILMYMYYLLASLGSNMQKRLAFIKSKLTAIQMVQLSIFIIHSSMYFLVFKCDGPVYLVLIYIPAQIINLGLFYQFYVKSYRKKLV